MIPRILQTFATAIVALVFSAPEINADVGIGCRMALSDHVVGQILTTMDGSTSVGRIASIENDTLAFETQLGVFRVSVSDIKVVRNAHSESCPHWDLQLIQRNVIVEQNDVTSRNTPTSRPGRKNPQTALALSTVVGLFLFDGAGQVYNGEHGKAGLLFAWSFVSKVMWFSDQSRGESYSAAKRRAIIGLVSNAASFATAAIDAHRSAKRINRERGYADRPRLSFGVGPVGWGSDPGLHAGVTF